MIRASSLTLAKDCGHFTELQARFPETSANAERGQAVDAENTRYLQEGVEPKDEDARACIKALRSLEIFHGSVTPSILTQDKVKLIDPATGEVLTEGTPDVQVHCGGDHIATVDWKKRDQWYAGYLSPPDDNLQLHAYSIARGLLLGAQSYQNVLILFGDGEAEPVASRVYHQEEWWPFIEQIRAIQLKGLIALRDGACPKCGRAQEGPNCSTCRSASPGPHCGGCWQKLVCGSYRERAKMALALLPADYAVDVTSMTDEQAGALADRASIVKAALDRAMDLVKAHHHAGGRVAIGGRRYVPAQCNGRKTADVASLEKDGLSKYVRQGAPYERWQWRKER